LGGADHGLAKVGDGDKRQQRRKGPRPPVAQVKGQGIEQEGKRRDDNPGGEDLIEGSQ
jgi:hypothetical protein